MDKMPVWTCCQFCLPTHFLGTWILTDENEKGAIQLLVDNVGLQHLVVESLGCSLCARHFQLSEMGSVPVVQASAGEFGCRGGSAAASLVQE